MCNQEVLVPIPPLLWDAGVLGAWEDRPISEFDMNDAGERCVKIDTCIVPAVKALWAAGVVTLSSCCGHGGAWGVVTIQTSEDKTLRGATVMGIEQYERLVSGNPEGARLMLLEDEVVKHLQGDLAELSEMDADPHTIRAEASRRYQASLERMRALLSPGADAGAGE